MAGRALAGMGPWNRGGLTIPPNSLHAWSRLAVWELWMGMLVCVTGGFGVLLIVTSPNHIVSISDLSGCYATPPVALPCERIVSRFGALDAVFTALWGVMMIGVAAWLLWELWSAVEPKPIADDFLRLLNDSFGRDWRKPLTWPWARVLWAYGFTLVGAGLTLGAGMLVWTLVASWNSAKVPTIRIDTSQSVTLGQ
jgi:hypothetical protein